MIQGQVGIAKPERLNDFEHKANAQSPT